MNNINPVNIDKSAEYNSKLQDTFKSKIDAKEENSSLLSNAFGDGPAVKVEISSRGAEMSEKVKNGDKVYNWLAYAKKFGFCDLERIHNPEAVSKYITKYITQDLAKSVTEINAHQYYHSRGLKTAEVIKKGTMSANIVPDFENEYCRILTCAYDEDLLNLLLSKIY